MIESLGGLRSRGVSIPEATGRPEVQQDAELLARARALRDLAAASCATGARDTCAGAATRGILLLGDRYQPVAMYDDTPAALRQAADLPGAARGPLLEQVLAARVAGMEHKLGPGLIEPESHWYDGADEVAVVREVPGSVAWNDSRNPFDGASCHRFATITLFPASRTEMFARACLAADSLHVLFDRLAAMGFSRRMQ